MSNIAKFYQTKTHDYENFFKNYESSSKEKELTLWLKGLMNNLKTQRLSCLVCRANVITKISPLMGKLSLSITLPIVVIWVCILTFFLVMQLISMTITWKKSCWKKLILKEVNFGLMWVIVSRLELLFLVTTNTESLQIISLVPSFLSMKVYFQSLIKTLPLSANLENLVSSLGEIVPQALLLNFMTFLKNKSEFIIILLNSNLL